ncbi:hypothetical protein [Agrobacterium vitis]|uniref:hypothetical protein n=1 Tax=Agrobacterium vitis TaxID=373 RepID=UPI0012E8A1F8|nr:hypothetical protein [Agrobacterium vitis]MVA36084.1 hypothetical protein [Agrobacterium vitis]
MGSIVVGSDRHVQKTRSLEETYPLKATGHHNQAYPSRALAGQCPAFQKTIARTDKLAIKTASDANAAMSCRMSLIAHSCLVMYSLCSPFVCSSTEIFPIVCLPKPGSVFP